MGELMIRCPNKNKEISTGIEVKPGDLAKLPKTRTFTQCPRCGMVHSWTLADARLSTAHGMVQRSDAQKVAPSSGAHELDA